MSWFLATDAVVPMHHEAKDSVRTILGPDAAAVCLHYGPTDGQSHPQAIGLGAENGSNT
jgi:hypothetical protein